MEKIRLSGENSGRRIFAAVLFLVIGGLAIAYGVSQLVSGGEGWRQIHSTAPVTDSCAGDFVLLYELGAGELSVPAENRALTAAYTQAAIDAFQLFHCGESFEGVTNLHDLNTHPNQILTVPDALYRALALLARQGERGHYLGPVYEIYNGLFSCQEDWQTEDFDPLENPELASYFGNIATFARDGGSVDIELLGGGSVRLCVSEEYLAFARENGFDRFLDLGWMKNAFIADYLAEALSSQGYTHGALSSYDGYTRNLDSRDAGYSLNIFQWTQAGAVPAAVMDYRGPMALVSLRGFPLTGDEYGFYRREDGQLRTPYVDILDGLPKAPGRALLCYGREAGCAETLLRMRPHFVADAMETAGLPSLAGEGVHALWCEGSTVFYTDPALTMTLSPGYSARLAE